MTSSLCTRRVLAVLLVLLALGANTTTAQVTTGTIYGQITDGSGGVLPGAVVLARNPQTGLTKDTTTDRDGRYKLLALPNGLYIVTTSMSGFRSTTSDIILNVSANVPLDLRLQLDGVRETLVVEGKPPRSSDLRNFSSAIRFGDLPTNGRQVADFVSLFKGVGGGLHSDPSKSTQRTPQIGGANGRNLTNLVDGGDNNDDTVGGMLQPPPLEAIQEINLSSFRFDAQNGRGAAVLNLITKSGTNRTQGSWFTFLRDEALNARTVSERNLNVAKQDSERYQYGGSLGGPIVVDRAHFFAAYERTQQDTKQVVDTRGALAGDGVYAVPLREHLFTGKVTATLNKAQYLALRYARAYNTQPSGAAPNAAYSTWVTSANSYDSLNVNHNWQTGPTSGNEFLFQYSRYLNDTPGNTSLTNPGPAYTLLNGARGGANSGAPQTTEQQRWQFRNDYSWTAHGTHQLRAGVNVLHTPTLAITNDSGRGGIFGLLGNNPQTSGVSSILLIAGHVASNIPLDLYGLYIQDDWRLTNNLTLNVGVRWDYLDGMPIAQSSPEFVAMQTAGQAGRFAGTHLDDFGKSPRGDYDNIQPRFGAVFDPFGNGRHLLRGGWGIYTDMAYTNANALTASLSGGGIVLDRRSTTGFLKTNGELFTINDPIESLGFTLDTPSTGEVVSPRLEQPYTRQANVGWEFQLTPTTSFTVDYVRQDGRDGNMRLRTNVVVNATTVPATRYLSDLNINGASFRTAVSKGRSQYDALIVAGRKRMSSHVDVDASYTLAKATSHIGTASDELTQNLLQDVNDPFSGFQQGPTTRTDARHRITASAIVEAPFGVHVASIFSFRSALPITTLVGQDVNGDGVSIDHTPLAYRHTGLNAAGIATFEEAGPCATVNCSRRAPFSQLNLRVSRSFRLFGRTRLEAIADVFNVLNAKNPFLPLSTVRLTSGGNPQAAFMQPTAYSGDVGQGEQRLAQLGARITF